MAHAVKRVATTIKPAACNVGDRLEGMRRNRLIEWPSNGFSLFLEPYLAAPHPTSKIPLSILWRPCQKNAPLSGGEGGHLYCQNFKASTDSRHLYRYNKVRICYPRFTARSARMSSNLFSSVIGGVKSVCACSTVLSRFSKGTAPRHWMTVIFCSMLKLSPSRSATA